MHIGITVSFFVGRGWRRDEGSLRSGHSTKLQSLWALCCASFQLRLRLATFVIA